MQTVLFSQQDGARQEKAIVEAALASSVVHPHVVSQTQYVVSDVFSSINKFHATLFMSFMNALFMFKRVNSSHDTICLHITTLSYLN